MPKRASNQRDPSPGRKKAYYKAVTTVKPYRSPMNKMGVPGGPEKKFVDLIGGNYICDTTGTTTMCNGIAQGTDYNQRVGRKFVMKSVHLLGMVEPEDSNTVGGSLVRVMLIYDAQPNGAKAAVTDVLDTASANSFMNLNNRDRFKTLIDKKFAVGKVDSTATSSEVWGPCTFKVDKFRKVNLEVVNIGTGATIASIGTGALLLLTVGTQAGGSAAYFRGSTRVRYTDE